MTMPSITPDITIVLITGASKGLGLQIARVLSTSSIHPGYHVIIGSLTPREGTDAISLLLAEDGSRSLSSVTIDVTSDTSISSAVASTSKQYGRIDVLINNAGLLLDDLNSPTTSRALFEKTYSVNVFGAVSVTDAFTPLLERSTSVPPRIVFISSRLGSLATSADANDRSNARWFPAYRSSKCALNMIMLHYARLFKERGWKINASDPGLSKTGMTSNQDDSIKGTVEEGGRNAIRLAILGKEGETGTFTSVHGAVDW